jgi:DNA-directed RNA polymerase sigma subunit (sigma70/sigma32)
VTRERIRQIQDGALKKLRRKMEQKDTIAQAI